MTPTARSFEDVEIWKKAHEFVLGVYRITEAFPKHELFGLTSQLRRGGGFNSGQLCRRLSKSN
jgi:hypothetical protein